MSAQPFPIVGREAEQRQVSELVDAIGDGPVALLLEGELGIGKTTLWKHGLAAARAGGARVLACRPVECETGLAYAALGDLLAEVPDEALATLPEPQRRALDIALLRVEPDGEEALQRSVALGTLGVLRALARERPTLVGVDDAGWLDRASSDALGFAIRRLDPSGDRIGLLVARRVEGAKGVPLGLDRALPDGRMRRLRLGPLGEATLDRVIAARVDAALPRRALARLHEAAGGNPFFAVEIARALVERGGPPAPADDLPIPVSLQELVSDRLAALPPPARAVAEIVAALSRPTLTLVRSALAGGGAAAAGVEAAVRAGVVELDGEQLGFTHPLLASVAYAGIAPAARRDLHRRLAELLDDPEERAKHLALAATLPDAAVAAALDEAARRASARGAPGTAAELSEQARRLTPAGAPGDARRRGIEAAERHFEAGQTELAAALLGELVEAAPPGGDRARALALLGWVRAHGENFHRGAEVFAAALAEPTDDVALRIEVEQGLAWCLHSTEGVEAARAHAATALRLAEAHGDPEVLAGALSHAAFLDSLGGRGIETATIERALRLVGPARGWSQILGRPDWIHALLLGWTGRLGQARERFGALHREAVERGDEHSLPFILFHLARLHLLTGDWEAATRHAAECRETTLQSGQVSERPYALTIEALVEAHHGLTDPAAGKIHEGLELARRLGVRPAALELQAVRGFLELSLGDAARADRTLHELAEEVALTGFHEPALFRFQGDAIEAKLALGRTDEARSLLDALDQLGAAPERTWVRMVAARSHGLLSAALGDAEAASAALGRALELNAVVEEPFEHARTLLALGAVRRRDRKKRGARDALQEALARFERLGAPLWAAKAEAELARVGGRPPAAGLTPTEQRVAELIAAGRTYQEAASALFISPKTVQWNLSKIYRKLGIRSRAELAARLAPPRGGAPEGSSPAGWPVPR